MWKVIEIREKDHFLRLRSTWTDLLVNSADDNPFITWEYLWIYWKYFGKNKELRILCIENGNNKMIAIIPLRFSHYAFASTLKYKVIEPLGYMGAEYNGFIIPSQEITHSVTLFKLILRYLEEKNDWDFIYLYEFPETSIVPRMLMKLNNLFKFEAIKGSICPYIRLPNSIDTLIESLNPNFRKNLKKRLRKLEKDFKAVELKSYKDFGTVDEAMNVFFNIHQKRWMSKGKTGVFASEVTRNFFVDIAKIFAEKGWLALYFLTVNDEPIAARYGFAYNRKMYFCLSGFDPNYSDYAPGHIVNMKVIEKCIRDGFTECDFLHGGEPYKFYWTNNYRLNVGFRFVNKRRVSARVYNLAIKVRIYGSNSRILKNPRSLPLYFPEEIAAKKCDLAIAPSKSVKDELISIYGVHPSKIKVIYNGVNTDQFKPMNKDLAKKFWGCLKIRTMSFG